MLAVWMLAVVAKIVQCTEFGIKITGFMINPALQPLKSDVCAHPTQQPLNNPRKNLLLPFISCHSVHSFYDYIHTSNLLCEIKGKQPAIHDPLVEVDRL